MSAAHLFLPLVFSEQKLLDKYEGKVTCMHWGTIQKVFTLVVKTMGGKKLHMCVCVFFKYCLFVNNVPLNSESK